MDNYDIFEKKKNDLGDIFSALKSLLSDVGLYNQASEAEQNDTELRNEKFNLVVVGEFSRGKSTFVNALLRRKLLPASKQPTTTVISKVVYGAVPSFTVNYKSGEKKNITQEEFDNIKAQSEGVVDKLKGILGTKKQVEFSDIDYLSIAYPLDFCKNGVELIDTPGVNDLNTNRVDITYGYMKKADAAIMLLSAMQTASKSELQFLREQIVGNQIKHLFIVVNGKDTLKTENDRQRIVEYVEKNVRDEVEGKLRIFLVSSKQAITWWRNENGDKIKESTKKKFLPASIEETGFPELEEALSDFLVNEKGKAKLDKHLSRAEHYVSVIGKQLGRQYDSVEHSSDDIKRQLLELRPRCYEAKSAAERSVREMRVRLMAHEAELVNEANKTFQEMRRLALEAVNGYDEDMSTSELQNNIEAAIHPSQVALIEKIDEMQQEWANAERQRVSSELQKIWNDLNLNDAMMVPVKNSQVDEKAVGQLDIYQEKRDESWDGLAARGMGAGIGILLAGGILPGLALIGGALALLFHSSKNVENAMREQIRTTFDTKYKPFIDGVKSSHEKQVSSICEQVQGAVGSRLADMEQELASVLKMKEESENNTEAMRDKLNRKKERLEHIKERLATI